MDLTSDAQVILVTGANGAGKTTILEACYLLARGRTFRGTKAGALTTRGAGYTRIGCRYLIDGGGEPRRLRYYKDHQGVQRESDPIGWPREDDWLTPFQVKLIGESSQVLLEGDPKLRRRFLDWNVFHVEPHFSQLHKSFTRALTQRNAAIRSATVQRHAWDARFIDLSQRLETSRRRFFDAWRQQFLTLKATFPFLQGYDLTYRRGWPEGQELGEMLEKLRNQEDVRGYTLAGPSRADFLIRAEDGRQGFSRGQAKVIVVLLQLSAERVHLAQGRHPTIWLLDDLEAELDQETAKVLWRNLSAGGHQVIATRVSASPVPGVFAEHSSLDTFHVKHGTIVCSG